MGGYGSTRWQWHTKKRTVEDCWTISITRLLRAGWLEKAEQGTTSGRIWWENGRGERLSWIQFTLRPLRERLLLTLHYKFDTGPNAGQEIEEPILLQYTEPYYGGRRWWFTCPLVVNGQACGRRVTKLHLPPGGQYYGCRHCYNLSYSSAQEAHKLDRSSSEYLRLMGKLDRLFKLQQRLDK